MAKTSGLESSVRNIIEQFDTAAPNELLQVSGDRDVRTYTRPILAVCVL